MRGTATGDRGTARNSPKPAGTKSVGTKPAGAKPAGAKPAATKATGRLPVWLRKRIPAGGASAEVAHLLDELGLATVCDGAHCPNRCECFARRTATFMILGATCTRNCRFCAVPTAVPPSPDPCEPERVAEAAARLGLRHVVVTSVTRDDLPDGGAAHFAATIAAVRARMPEAIVEVLTPDFQGDLAAVATVLAARPDVFNHNIETVPRLYKSVRPQADYARSLAVLRFAADWQAGRLHHKKRQTEYLQPSDCDAGVPPANLHTKSGLMVGLGETDEEVRAVMRDLRAAGVEILTIGQYLAPSDAHLPVARFVEPKEFERWRAEGLALGFRAVAAGPFVRSSYQAGEVFGTMAASGRAASE